jgi:hypothetical protein
MDIRQKTNFYEFKTGVGVVEILINSDFKTIKGKLDEFMIEDKSTSIDSWQVLYMEQYFSADRTKKLCDTYNEPADDTEDFFLTFFIYFLTEGQVLHTPYGSVKVMALKKLPREYRRSLDFEDAD